MKPRNPFLVLAWSYGLFLLAYSHQYLYVLLVSAVSGTDSTLGIFESRLSRPGFLTGGKFGVELSLVTLAVYLILAFLFIKLPWRGKPLLLKAKPLISPLIPPQSSI